MQCRVPVCRTSTNALCLFGRVGRTILYVVRKKRYCDRSKEVEIVGWLPIFVFSANRTRSVCSSSAELWALLLSRSCPVTDTHYTVEPCRRERGFPSFRKVQQNIRPGYSNSSHAQQVYLTVSIPKANILLFNWTVRRRDAHASNTLPVRQSSPIALQRVILNASNV